MIELASNQYKQILESLWSRHGFLALIPIAAIMVLIVGSISSLSPGTKEVWGAACFGWLYLLWLRRKRQPDSEENLTGSSYRRKAKPAIDRKRLDVLLAEYDASHVNRGHYDQTRWIIGSIFIVSSFTLISASFLDSVLNNRVFVAMMGGASLVLWLVFLYYDAHVQPWVTMSLDRCFAIEQELHAFGFDIRLHSNMRYMLKQSDDKIDVAERRTQIGAFWMVVTLTILMATLWVLRIIVVAR